MTAVPIAVPVVSMNVGRSGCSHAVEVAHCPTTLTCRSTS